MPELPEVETMRRGVLPIVGSRIQSVRLVDCGYRPIRLEPSGDQFCQTLRGRTIQAIDRLGKRVVLRLDDSRSVVIEPRMTGLVLLTAPPDETHLRVGFQLDHPEHPWLWFWDRRGLGCIHCWTESELNRRLGPSGLGMDALEITEQDLRRQLDSSRRAVKVALLDQHAVAGIGNLYASEILHLAGVDPRTRCDRVRGPQWTRIHTAIREVLEDAILHEGSTLSDGTYRNALNQQGSYQSRHRVYDRADEVCPRCLDVRIRRIVQAQRSTFFCPACQKRG